MGNILNHNREIISFDIVKEDYWDFQLCIDTCDMDLTSGLTERCLSVYIDFTDDECIWFDEVYSKDKYVWDKSVNENTLTLNNFGYTSVDNGKTHYEKDRITNRDFFRLFTETKFTPRENDKRLILYKVYGNQQIYDYTNDITLWKDKFQVSRLNGGWYQGFFCANEGSEYKTLPTDIGDGWNFEFELNKEDFVNDKDTLNDMYPENKGIFFYIGTRAENKWWVKYLTDHDFDWCKKSGFSDDYVNKEYTDTDSLNDNYFKALVEVYESDGYFSEDYLTKQENTDESAFSKEYNDDKPCDVCSNYADLDYIEKDMEIDENMRMETDSGYDMYQPNIKEIKTDNKFILFDRTKEGVTVKNWDEHADYRINYIKKPNIGNYFTLFHRGCDGYDVKKIQQVLDIKNKEYNVLKDLYRNALAFQIKDDGSIGYKYLVADCDSEIENYKIESEFSKQNLITDGEWNVINIKIIPIKHNINKIDTVCLTTNSSSDKMQIMFYLNGKLVFISKELPMLNLKPLDDLYEKQEGVPFNISVGGGTQGLAEVVYLNYLKLPEYTLPLEKEFGGSFIGWIKSFKFYTCPLNFMEIQSNFDFARTV